MSHRDHRDHRAKVRITPVAQRIAAALAVDLQRVRPSGPGGLILKRDVIAAEQTSSVIPWCMTLREVYLPTSEGLDTLALLAVAVIAALPHHQRLNSSWAGDALRIHRSVHLEVQRDQWSGVIAHAEELSLRGLARAIAAGSTAAVAPTITIGQLPPGSLLRSQPPSGAQCAAVWIGVAQRWPVVIDGECIVVRPMAPLALTYDARILSQREADAFLAEVCQRMRDEG